jgi:hypothetical protein
MALFGHAAISEFSLLSGVKRKLDFEPAKGRFWREAVILLYSPLSSSLSCAERAAANSGAHDTRRVDEDSIDPLKVLLLHQMTPDSERSFNRCRTGASLMRATGDADGLGDP